MVTVPWGGVFRGKEEVGSFFASLPEHLDELNVEPHEFYDAGQPFETRFAMVWTMRDGKAVAFKEYTDMVPIAKAYEAQVA
jgi:ketosteroid isomerase-like protein